jgi:hypothetical protein
LNTLTKNLLLLLLLSGTFIFPACRNQEVKSQKTSETVLKSGNEITMTPTAGIDSSLFFPQPTATTTPSPTPTHSYTQHHSFVKHHVRPHVVKQPIMAAITPLVSPIPTPTAVTTTSSANFTADSEMPRKKSGSHWPLILAGIVLVAALGFYFWTKKNPPHNDFPLPPMGGLSPIGGFTAMRNKVQPKTKKQSIWTKKTF